MTQISDESKKLPARPDKTIAWLNKSRDDWKDKTQTAKSELKVAKQAQKRARQSREEWKTQSRKLEVDNRQQEKALVEKNEEITTLRLRIQELNCENEDLKKKHLLRLMTQK